MNRRRLKQYEARWLKQREARKQGWKLLTDFMYPKTEAKTTSLDEIHVDLSRLKQASLLDFEDLIESIRTEGDVPHELR